jgi:hypothetical protein
MKIFTIEKIETVGIEIPAVCVGEGRGRKLSYTTVSGVDEQKMGNVCLYENRMGYSSSEIYPIPPLVELVNRKG